MLCDTTLRRTLVVTNGLWCVAARAWHEPPTDTCSVVSASPSHSISIKIVIPDFPLFFMRFPVGHSNFFPRVANLAFSAQLGITLQKNCYLPHSSFS